MGGGGGGGGLGAPEVFATLHRANIEQRDQPVLGHF